MNDEVVTEAKPHTIKKFELIETYVDNWARKILGFNGGSGREGSKGVVFIDCMSNSGLYRDVNRHQVEGTAIRVAKCLNRLMENYPTKKGILIFNDKREDRIETLKEEIEKLNLENVEIYFHVGDCHDFLSSGDVDQYKKKFGLLLFYDPYNASINWDVLEPYFTTWGEVIINHMVSDSVRGLKGAKNQNVKERYRETYQQPLDIIRDMNKAELNQLVLNNISSATRNFPQTYVASFPFFTTKNGLLYHLIFCSHNIAGFKLFKTVSWKTFGDKSSLKNDHRDDRQMEFAFERPETPIRKPDVECYRVEDIAQYAYDHFRGHGRVTFEDIYAYIDAHPFFPTDGYKNEIKKELARFANVKIQRQSVFFS